MLGLSTSQPETSLQALAESRPGGLEAKEEELLRYCRVRSVEISRAIRTGTEVPPPRAAAPEATPSSTDLDLDAELAALAPPPPAAAAAAPKLMPAGSASFTAADAAAAAAAEAARPAPPPSKTSWNDLPAAPAHAPPPSLPPGAERLPAIFTRGVFVTCFFASERRKLQQVAVSGRNAVSCAIAAVAERVRAVAGARILYKADSLSTPQEGRIVNATAGTATVTTSTATAEATPAQLAPYLPSGSEVMLPSSNPAAGMVTATVLRDTADTEWPPVYTVRLPDATTLAIGHARFMAVSAPPGATAGPRVAASPLPPPEMPPVAATLPGPPPSHAQVLVFFAGCRRALSPAVSEPVTNRRVWLQVCRNSLQ